MQYFIKVLSIKNFECYLVVLSNKTNKTKIVLYSLFKGIIEMYITMFLNQCTIVILKYNWVVKVIFVTTENK